MARCDICGKEFRTEDALAQHLKDRHASEAPVVARAQTEEPHSPKARARSLRRRNRHPVALGLIAIAVAASIVVYFVAAPAFAGPPFSCTTGETWIHVHPYVTIQIEGKNITVPAGVGIVQTGSCLQPVHTHDASGILHIELLQADAKAHNFTLGDFFNIWNYTAKSVSGTAPTLGGVALPVEFSQNNILGFRANSTFHIVLLVDGKPSTQWGSLNLEALDYCNAKSSGAPCYPTACASPTTCYDPIWKGGGSYPYGFNHTIVIEYVRS